MSLHFVGFRDGSEFFRAMQIFGIPDFIHVKVDARFIFGGELDPASDVVIFAKASGVSSLQEAEFMVQQNPKMASVDDSDMSAIGKWHMRPPTGQVPW